MCTAKGPRGGKRVKPMINYQLPSTTTASTSPNTDTPPLPLPDHTLDPALSGITDAPTYADLFAEHHQPIPSPSSNLYQLDPIPPPPASVPTQQSQQQQSVVMTPEEHLQAIAQHLRATNPGLLAGLTQPGFLESLALLQRSSPSSSQL